MPTATLALKKENRCRGFTKEHRRCRLERAAGSLTCQVHKHYFEHENILYLAKNFDPHITTPRKGEANYRYHEEMTQLLLNHETSFLVKPHLYDILEVSRHSYTWYCRFTHTLVRKKEPIHKPLFKGFCYTLSEHYRQCTLLNLPFNSVIAAQLDDITCDPVLSKLTLFYTLRYIVNYILWNYEFIDAHMHTNQPSFKFKHIQSIGKFYSLPAWRRLYGSKSWTSILDRIRDVFSGRNPEVLELILVEMVKPGLRQACLNHKDFIYNRCNLFKEELMMNRWHPSRVAAMVDADRWDLM